MRKACRGSKLEAEMVVAEKLSERQAQVGTMIGAKETT